MSRNIKYTCPGVQPSGCSLYTGEFPNFIDPSTLSCDPNLDTVLELYGNKIDQVLAQIDLSALNKKCLDFDPDTVSVHGLFQKQIDKLCALDDALAALQDTVDDLDIGQMEVTLDLKCMKPLTNICGLPADHYTLTTVLNILVNEICNIKSKL